MKDPQQSICIWIISCLLQNGPFHEPFRKQTLPDIYDWETENMQAESQEFMGILNCQKKHIVYSINFKSTNAWGECDLNNVEDMLVFSALNMRK